MKVYGSLCEECAGAQWGATRKDGKHVTVCRFLATEVENTDDSIDRCYAFVKDPPVVSGERRG